MTGSVRSDERVIAGTNAAPRCPQPEEAHGDVMERDFALVSSR